MQVEPYIKLFGYTLKLTDNHCGCTGAIYFLMKDLTQEFIKLHVIFACFEMMDKVGCLIFCLRLCL